MFKDRLCFNNLHKSFDRTAELVVFRMCDVDTFSSFWVVWLIDKKKKKKLVAIETINNKITGTFTAPRMLHCEVQL